MSENGGNMQTRTGGAAGAAPNRRVRHLALALMSLALAFYFGFIALTVYRSHH